jgi:putative oxidoreductase
MTRLLDLVLNAMTHIPYSLLALVGRLSIALVFWNSGRSKVDGWNIFHVNDRTLFLFSEEYRLFRLFGTHELWIIPPWLAAVGAQLAEHALPVLLALGLATRLSALGLLGMTLVIEIFVYPGAYVVHGTWAAILLMLMKFGPGTLSLDHFLYRR